MRYEEARRSRGVESIWLRAKLWLHASRQKRRPKIRDMRLLSDYERRDIGLAEPVQYVDWRSLRENGWL